MEEKSHQSEILTIMFTDIVGYTSTTARLNRKEFNQLHDVFDNISLPIFKKHSGNVIKKIGDSFMVTFKSATEGVLCGIDLQKSFQKHHKENQSRNPLRIRVALHSGEVLLRDNDVYGDAVNLSARVEGLTQAGEIYFTESVAQSMNKNEIDFLDLGYTPVKGFSEPIRIFKVKWKRDQRRILWGWILETFLIVLLISVIIVAAGFLYKTYF
ncbi:adenylate/guanylate cyclase domain-containing protein [Candidatus Woesearchaeota archaeon]|jgi:class 3 adenylate cyclase|nr:adenylate/guanylate cyclase domain-containing protein [Candidatus Woesearchaeota archaeon]MBT4111310.1 adenylate/guanylate cyclase domain-containing protein [Candidatus Woesearchaeota archaeon]MBT4335779.1 adenylate/guanylate cyclase domain-containing protein [Candidatus Woesearchaeota archaeon]MBT4469243.1 adenylate/guanylate cyclase domain-containing protein [Candidatus Woesearchaeota archaeon]MBT6744408.1 adenylate/guanylate cyclase domain-containing protein [Candidatus Woesearchaeota arc